MATSERDLQESVADEPALTIGNAVNKAYPKLRLRTTLIVPFVLQIITAVGLVGYLSFRNGQQAVSDIAKQLGQEVTNRINERLRAYMAVPPLLNRMTADAIAAGYLNPRDRQSLGRHIWQQVTTFEGISFRYFGNNEGEMITARRLPSGTVLPGYSNANTNWQLTYFNPQRNGDPADIVESVPRPFNPRQRPWYLSATAAQKPVWTPIYRHFVAKELSITAAQPVYDRSGTLQGVLGVDFVFSQVNRYLQSLKIGKTGLTFAIERSGNLVVSSTPEPTFTSGNEQTYRIAAADSKNPLISAAARYLKQQFPNLNNLYNNLQAEFVDTAGKRYFLQVTPLRDAMGIDWLIVVVIPESDFMEQINANTRHTILLCLIALVVAIAIGIVSSRWVTRPVLEVSQAANALAQGNLDQHIEFSPITEIDTLADSFNGMAGQLKQSFKTLEIKNEELRIAEENYRGIFENALEGIFQSLPNGRFISINPAMARIYGYNSPQEMIETIANVGEQLYANALDWDEFERLMQQQGQVENFEFQAYRQDRSIIWVEMHARIVCDRQAKISYYEGIVQDISDRKRQKEILEATVKERTADLVAANQEIVTLNKKLKAENLRMSAELDVARQIQRTILPKAEELNIEGLDMAAYMEPADEVGGDYYDVLHTNGVVTMGIGDVTGHGLESGILMLMTQTAVRTLQEFRETDPVKFLDTLNRTIYKNVQRMNSHRNLTLAILNYAEGQISISGQHEETILVRNEGKIERIDTLDLGFPIGLDEEIADFISHVTLDLQPGDGVVLYTDGITEARDIDNNQYGIEQLCQVISQNWHQSVEEIKDAVIADIRQHIGKQKVFDDITLLVMKRQGYSEISGQRPITLDQ